MSGVELLLFQQNQLLMSQLKELQVQVKSSQSRAEAIATNEAMQAKMFHEPRDLLEGIDPGLHHVFDEFAKEVKHLLSAWETQTKLLEKYKRLEDEGALHSHFKAEADFKWQFTKLYLAKAVPLDVDDMSDGQFSVVDSWAAMRTRHAKECFQFVLQHQGQCVKFYDELIASSSLQQLLADRLDAWFAQHNYADEEIRHALKHRAVQYVESLLRVERPRVQSRMVKDREQQQKREQALLEARSKWEEMDVKDVLSPALFELKQLDARQKRPTKIKDDSALAFLVKDNAELCQKHKLKIVPVSEIAKSQQEYFEQKGFYALLHRQAYKGVHNLVPAELALGELVQFEPKPCNSNQTWIDMKAQIWLRRHAEFICIVDCDKGLGDAIVLRSWIVEQIKLQLSKGYVQITEADFLYRMGELKHCADALVQYFATSGALSKAEVLFLRSSFDRASAGTFRILVKVHKDPIGSRPICNMRQCWFQPLSAFLVEKLAPLVSPLASVIVSTDQLLQQLDSVECLPNMVFVTLDVVNLYPSISRPHMMSLVANFLRPRIKPQSLCEFIIRALELVLDACVVSFGGGFYQSYDGIPTGLSVASILANIYLWHFDNFVVQQSGEQMQMIRRFIDDLLLLWSGDVNKLVSLANSWHESLRFELSGVSDVHFLDIALSIMPDRRVHWELYHKEQNLYLYVPANSNHPSSTFKSLQIGGALRCQKRNRLRSDALASLKFFKRRLKDRGFDMKKFDDTIAKFQNRTRKRDTTVRKVHLKVHYNKDVSAFWIASKLRKFSALLRHCVPDVQVGTCWTVGRNLFRSRYQATWKFFSQRRG
ncbi:hypothetical protein AK812_SmicGene29280 [Symbiodinium microadriaticum]|uniref:Reverse transcriptase domain-containing protein n=1 Tax=Symbiodinium microadriaticum TaxID=2951 RepID=A0A1Q9D288_SYMMI|nr:hypothetical protein AK812_SmicGene29280 [Symbiodinium microadriaticum]